MARILTDQVIVITGASSGIGAATAVACARAGMQLVLNGRRTDHLERVAAQCRTLGRDVEVVVGDVTEAGLTERLLDAAERRFGRFDVVYANAGYGVHAPIHEMSAAALRRIFEVNFFAATELLAAAANRLIAAKRPGHLLMCSSAAAKFALPTFAAYSATKAAQNHICRAMRIELRAFGIEVSSVHPITTRTEFFTTAAALSAAPEDTAHEIERLPRMMVQTSEQVAHAIVRRLRRPRPEVWTSFLVRFVSGVATIFPSLFDIVALKVSQRRGRM